MYTHNDIEITLRNHKPTLARIDLLEMLSRNDDRAFLSDYATNKVDLLSNESVDAEKKRLKVKARLVDIWLSMLSPEERFVIETHTIGGLDWARMMVEEDKIWGQALGRSMRTLKRIQARAIQKICSSMNSMCNN